MCGGLPQLKVGSVVRRLTTTGPQAVIEAVLGEVINIDRADKRRFTYTVKFDDGQCEIGQRKLFVLTSRKKHAKVVDLLKNRGSLEHRVETIRQRMAEKRAARQAKGGAQ